MGSGREGRAQFSAPYTNQQGCIPLAASAFIRVRHRPAVSLAPGCHVARGTSVFDLRTRPIGSKRQSTAAHLPPRRQLVRNSSRRWAAAAGDAAAPLTTCCSLMLQVSHDSVLSSADSRRLSPRLRFFAIDPERRGARTHFHAWPPEAARWRCSILGVLVAQHPLRIGVVWSTEHARRSYTNGRGLASATRLCCLTCLAQHVCKRLA